MAKYARVDTLGLGGDAAAERVVDGEDWSGVGWPFGFGGGEGRGESGGNLVNKI